MSALEDVRAEWAKGPFRLSTEDSAVVMARLAELEAQVESLPVMVRAMGEQVFASPADALLLATAADVIERLDQAAREAS